MLGASKRSYISYVLGEPVNGRMPEPTPVDSNFYGVVTDLLKQEDTVQLPEGFEKNKWIVFKSDKPLQIGLDKIKKDGKLYIVRSCSDLTEGPLGHYLGAAKLV